MRSTTSAASSAASIASSARCRTARPGRDSIAASIPRRTSASARRSELASARVGPQIATSWCRLRNGERAAPILLLVAKDTEKLIRQLSLISFLMANGRPVSALEIKREVEGYSSMNDDAFARRFYADRAELESLGISLQVEKPAEGFLEAELYALPPENYYLPPIEFTDGELAALRTALGLLDGEFAYAEPLRLALQQVSWGRPSPLQESDSTSIEVRMTAKADGAEVSQRLAKIETAISRRKTIEFTYYTIERDTTEKRKVDPYHLVYRGGQLDRKSTRLNSSHGST